MVGHLLSVVAQQLVGYDMAGFQLLVYFQMYLKRKAMNIHSYFDIDIAAVAD